MKTNNIYTQEQIKRVLVGSGVDICGRMWANDDICGRMWANDDICGLMWANDDICGRMWANEDIWVNVG